MRYLVVLLFAILQSSLIFGIPEKRSEKALNPSESTNHQHDTGMDIQDQWDQTGEQAAADEPFMSVESQEGAKADEVGHTQQSGQTQQTGGTGQTQGAELTGHTDTPAAAAGAAGANAQAGAAAPQAQAGKSSSAGASSQAGQSLADVPGLANLPAGTLQAAGTMQASNVSTPRIEKPEAGSLSPANPRLGKNGSDSEAIPQPEQPQIDPPAALGEIPGLLKSGPKTAAPFAAVPMAMVHSEVSPGAVHTMEPGESILGNLALPAHDSDAATNMATGLIAPSPNQAPPKPTPVVQGATFEAGGQVYTASIDRDLNVVLGTSILKPGGAAATLAEGAAVISVVPGGALVVDGGTLTMSALHPPVTGAVVNFNGRLVTASQQSGANGNNLIVLGSATITAGAPAVTIQGQVVSFGNGGLRIGRTVASISTISYTEPPAVTATAWLTAAKGGPGSGLVRMSGSVSTGLQPKETHTATALGANKNGAASLQISLGSLLLSAAVLLFIGG